MADHVLIFVDLLNWLKETLSEHVKEVRLYTRLTESPACLITDGFDHTGSRALYQASGQDILVSKRILELNPNHPLVSGLRKAHEDRGDDPAVAETAELLYGTALLTEGGALEDPARFAELLADRLARMVQSSDLHRFPAAPPEKGRKDAALLPVDGKWRTLSLAAWIAYGSGRGIGTERGTRGRSGRRRRRLG